MPSVPYSTRCTQYGCRNPRSKLNSYCSEHGGKDSLSRDYDALYNTKAWKQIRTAHLSTQPLCQGCLAEGKVVQAAHVDHVFPWRQIGEEAFRRNIFQALCHSHHSYKTSKEAQGKFLEWVDGDVRTHSLEDYRGRVG